MRYCSNGEPNRYTVILCVIYTCNIEMNPNLHFWKLTVNPCDSQWHGYRVQYLVPVNLTRVSLCLSTRPPDFPAVLLCMCVLACMASLRVGQLNLTIPYPDRHHNQRRVNWLLITDKLRRVDKRRTLKCFLGKKDPCCYMTHTGCKKRALRVLLLSTPR